MDSVSPFSIEYLLRSDREEDDEQSNAGNSSEEVLTAKTGSDDCHELPGKNSIFSTGCRPSFLFGNDTENPNVKYKKMSRTCISSYQKEELEKSFGKSPYLPLKEREQLAIKLGLPSQVNVQTWYKNRRYKWRRENGKGSLPRATQSHRAASFMSTQAAAGRVPPYSACCCLGHCPTKCQIKIFPSCFTPISHTPRVFPCPLSKYVEGVQANSGVSL